MDTVQAHSPENDDAIKEAVRDRYAKHARTKTSCCSSSSCCGTSASSASLPRGTYTAAELAALPDDADLGLGCGNPLALSSLVPGETVVDLGNGAGIDCFIAANRVGPEGHVIGIDMTPEMIALARRNAQTGGYTNVEFRLGEIEALPLPDETADIVISNCVINLVPDKRAAFTEAFRVTKPGGRLSVSDIVTSEPVPEAARASLAAYVACLGGALVRESYLSAIAEAGWEDIRVVSDTPYATTPEEADQVAVAFGIALEPTMTVNEVRRTAMLFHSITVHAQKPLVRQQ